MIIRIRPGMTDKNNEGADDAEQAVMGSAVRKPIRFAARRRGRSIQREPRQPNRRQVCTQAGDGVDERPPAPDALARLEPGGSSNYHLKIAQLAQAAFEPARETEAPKACHRIVARGPAMAGGRRRDGDIEPYLGAMNCSEMIHQT